jgi:hypothetical protein
MMSNPVKITTMRKVEIRDKAQKSLFLLSAHQRGLTQVDGGMLEKLYHIEHFVWLLKSLKVKQAIKALYEDRGVTEYEIYKLLNDYGS